MILSVFIPVVVFVFGRIIKDLDDEYFHNYITSKITKFSFLRSLYHLGYGIISIIVFSLHIYFLYFILKEKTSKIKSKIILVVWGISFFICILLGFQVYWFVISGIISIVLFLWIMNGDIKK